MGHDQARVEISADAVPGKVTDHPVAEPPRIRLDDPANRVQRPSRSDRADAAHHRLLGALDQQPGLLVRIPGQEGRVGVAVHAADEAGDVDVHDVAVGDHRVIRDPVADRLVERRAERFGVPAVAERARVGAVVAEELVPDAVQFVGGDAGRHVPADLGQGAGREPPGNPHARDRLGILDVGLAGFRVPPAHVLRGHDVRGHLSQRGNPAGLEQRCHDLEV